MLLAGPVAAPMWWRSVTLGLVQGLTEFLPVSSSGHLVLAERLLGMPRPGLALETGLHAGTLVAVVWAYRADLYALTRARPGATATPALLAWLLFATLPAALAGLLLRGVVERMFDRLGIVALALGGTGALLFAAERRPPGTRGLGHLRLCDAVRIGLWQAAALVPGLSRSGATIAAGRLGGLAPLDAARFSFLLSLPTVGGAVLLHAGALMRGAGEGGVWLGAAAAAASGSLAIAWCVDRLRRGTLRPFAYYCCVVSALCLLRLAIPGG